MERLVDRWPVVAAQLRTALAADGEYALTSASAEHLARTAGVGMLILDVVDGDIKYVEVIDRPTPLD